MVANRFVKVQSRIGKAFAKIDDVIKSRVVLATISTFWRDRVYQFTKRGLTLAKIRQRGGPPTIPLKLKPLSPNYIEYRKSLVQGEAKRLRGGILRRSAKAASKKAKKSFGEFFSPARSNLTLTGQLLDAVDSDYDSEAGTVTVFVKATSRTGAEPDEPQTNAELAVKVAEEGRPFLGLDLIGRARIRRIVIAELRRQLKRR
jgi:hypothetical protein